MSEHASFFEIFIDLLVQNMGILIIELSSEGEMGMW